ncbi:MAG: HAD-IA family hydrolase, partial [Vulcanimicrobiaceae bacterium]
KTRAFAEIVARGALPARPGVVRIARELHERGVQLAIASTSAEGSVRAVLESVAGEEFAREFRVFAGDIVPHKKPAPDIYRLALERLGVGAEAALVIEDSRNGLLSASRAGLATLVTVTGFTRNEPMEEAALVLSSLGDPGGPPVEVIANRTAAEIGPYATSETLEACLAFRAAQSSI